MNKDEILEKSRRENKNQDEFDKQVVLEGSRAGIVVAAILATIFLLVQIYMDGGMNYGMYGMLFAMMASMSVVKAIRIKRKYDIALAVFHTGFALLLCCAHLYNLLTASAGA